MLPILPPVFALNVPSSFVMGTGGYAYDRIRARVRMGPAAVKVAGGWRTVSALQGALVVVLVWV